jgi:hypothetical protein
MVPAEREGGCIPRNRLALQTASTGQISAESASTCSGVSPMLGSHVAHPADARVGAKGASSVSDAPREYGVA